jgi:hypothetical protein
MENTKSDSINDFNSIFISHGVAEIAGQRLINCLTEILEQAPPEHKNKLMSCFEEIEGTRKGTVRRIFLDLISHAAPKGDTGRLGEKYIKEALALFDSKTILHKTGKFKGKTNWPKIAATVVPGFAQMSEAEKKISKIRVCTAVNSLKHSRIQRFKLSKINGQL